MLYSKPPWFQGPIDNDPDAVNSSYSILNANSRGVYSRPFLCLNFFYDVTSFAAWHLGGIHAQNDSAWRHHESLRFDREKN